MNPNSSKWLRSLLAASFLLTAALPAQVAGDVREMSIPNGSITLLNVTSATITGQLTNGFRLTDLEYRSGAGAGTRFDAVLVESTGPYATGYWWYFDASGSQIASAIAANQARLIDLESYEDSFGNRRFAAVMVDNTGPNAKGWWWLYDTNPAAIGQFVATNTARIVDLDTYEVNGVTRYLAVMISNTGGDTRQWWWYTNVSSSQIDGYMATNGARVYDIEKNIGGAFDCVLIRDPLPKDTYWWSNLTAAEVEYLQQNHGARAFDIERYPSTFGATRYAMATINNSNPLTTEVGNRMRNATGGQVGCWLQEVNGANLAWLNGTTAFEPAEALTVLHHAHSMRRIYLGSSQPISLLTVFQDYSTSSAGCPVDSNPTVESLVTVLRSMMRSNDSRRTQAVTNYYGQSNINTTASPLLAMNATELNHRIGCVNEAFADPNRTSLRDLHRLHETVANGWLGAERDRFYELMNDSTGAIGLDLVILQEGGQLNLPMQALDCFSSYLRIAHKRGDYQLFFGSQNHAAQFGWISVPFIQNGVASQREFTFGAFVNDASSSSGASVAVFDEAIPELLRPTIRAALSTWTPNVACSTYLGSGCGSPTHQLQPSAPPRIGTTVQYQGADGYPNAISALAIGLSSTQSGGLPLPIALEPIGGENGCRALNDAVTSQIAISNGVGASSFPFVVPSAPSLVGFEYFTQAWSFGPTSLKTSNSLRNIVGL